MTRDMILELVTEIAQDSGCGVDGFVEEVADAIIDDNGFNLTEEDVKELASQFFEEED